MCYVREELRGPCVLMIVEGKKNETCFIWAVCGYVKGGKKEALGNDKTEEKERADRM